MRTIFGLVLLVGLALGGAAVYLAKNYINQTQTELQQWQQLKKETNGLVRVFVVSKPKAYGDTLTKDDVEMILWPRNKVPEGAFVDPEVLFPADQTDPRYVVRPMEALEPILAVKVTEPGEQAGLNGSIEKGMRAFAIKVEAADFLQPGDRVDVYWTGAVQGTEGEMTRLIETTMKIIAVDRNAKDGAAAGEIQNRTMTVAATPEQVGRLAQAQATGRLAMSLVGNGDEVASGQVEVDTNGMLGITAAQPVAETVAPKTCSIKTRKGSDVVEIPIPCTN
jgi:pilus assembly protein CpaB